LAISQNQEKIIMKNNKKSSSIIKILRFQKRCTRNKELICAAYPKRKEFACCNQTYDETKKN